MSIAERPVEIRAKVSVTIDGAPIDVFEGDTILDACNKAGKDTPTVCYGPTVTPVNACRACVVEVEGNRTLVPSCSRPAEDGMVVTTDTERVDQNRKMVLEFLATSSDVSQSEEIMGWVGDYGADLDRYDPDTTERMTDEVKIEDDLYIRAYDRCVLCYKCVEACGEDAQWTFAIAMTGRGFNNRIATEFNVELPDSACVYCGNCVAVCPTNALQFKTEFDLRKMGDWKPEEQTVSRTVCSCNLDLHVQDNTIVKVTSPDDHSITSGNLCVKGRFGYQYVQNRPST